MNYGMYLSASGVMTNMYRQDVFAHNLSNSETTAYKPDLPSIKQRDPQRIEGQFAFDASDRLLDRLGGGVLAGPQRIDLSPAPMQQTDNPLDVALENENEFFAVRVAGAEDGDGLRLTRDGRLQRNAQGELVTVAGHRVLDPNDQPIVIPEQGPVRINNAGQVMQNGAEVGRLQVAHVPEPDVLRKQAGNVFAFDGPDPRQIIEGRGVRSGFIEASGVDPIQMMMRMVSATKAAQGNAEMIRYHDQMMNQAVNTLGMVA